MKDKLNFDTQLFRETEESSQNILNYINTIDSQYKIDEEAYLSTDDILSRKYTLRDDYIEEFLWPGINDYHDLYSAIMLLPLEANMKNTNDRKVKLFKKTIMMSKPAFELAYNRAIFNGRYKGKFSEVFRVYVKKILQNFAQVWNANDQELVRYLSHYLSFVKAYGPMSYYTPEGMLQTVAGYFRQEKVEVSLDEAELLAIIIVTLARIFYEIGKPIKPMDIDETALKMRTRNPIAAYSLVTLGSARNDEDFETNLALTKRVAKDPFSSPLVFMLQTRLTSKGNTFIDYLSAKGYLDENGSIVKLPSPSVVDDYIGESSRNSAPFIYFVDESVPLSDRDRYCKPISDELRNRYVLEEEGFNFLEEKKKDGSYRYTHYVEDAYMYHPDDSREDTLKNKARVKTKIRSVFAGSGHWALIGATYLYSLQDAIMDSTYESGKCRNFRANWSEPIVLQNAIENMFSAIDQYPEIFSAISADDKSGFDNYVPAHLTIPFYAYILANKFDSKSDKLISQHLAQLGSATRLAPLWSPYGLLSIPHAVPSGMSFTNLVDSFCSLVLGIYSNLMFIRKSPENMAKFVPFFENNVNNIWERPELQGVNVQKKDEWIIKYILYMTDNKIEPVVNGDDYSGLWLTGMTLADIAESYKKLGFIVHPTKGIASPAVTEFSAKVFYKGATVKLKQKNEERGDEYSEATVISNGIPFPRSFYKDIFKEDSPTKSEMIEDLGILDRITNHQAELFTPAKFLDEHLSVTHSTLGMEPYNYVMLQDRNTEEKKTTLIKDPYDVVLAAGDDAAYLKTTLAVIRDRTWDDSYDELMDSEDPFSMRRSVQYIRAIRDDAKSKLASLEDAVTFIGTEKYNQVGSPERTEHTTSLPQPTDDGTSAEVGVITGSINADSAAMLALALQPDKDTIQLNNPLMSIRFPLGMIKWTDNNDLPGIYAKANQSALYEQVMPTSTKQSIRTLARIIKQDYPKLGVIEVNDDSLAMLTYLVWMHYRY